MKLSELGELGLLAELEQRGLATGIEHDAAALAGGVVVTQDALVEGVHFRLDWISWRDLGWRAAAVNLSDLAASGADAEGLIVALAAPGDTELDAVLELYAGMAETGVPVVGGDTTRAERGRSQRHRDRPGGTSARPRRCASRRCTRGDGRARRRRGGVSASVVRASAAATGRGTRARRPRSRNARPLRRAGASTHGTSPRGQAAES